MKRIIAACFGILSFTAPAFVFADSVSIPLGQTIQQITAVTAAIEAQEAAASSGRSIACAALFSAPSVQVNQPVALAWGSVGAINPAVSSSTQSMWTQNGSTMVTIQQPGTWTYSFTFYGASGATATCTAKIVVTSAS